MRASILQNCFMSSKNLIFTKPYYMPGHTLREQSLGRHKETKLIILFLFKHSKSDPLSNSLQH